MRLRKNTCTCSSRLSLPACECYPMNSILTILGVNIHALPMTDLLSQLQDSLQKRQRLLVGNVNIHALNLAWERASFQKALNSFDIVFCDGFGVKLGAWLIGKHIPERYTPPDFIHQVMQIASKQGGGVFLLGAAPGVALHAAQALLLHTPELRIAGTQHGYFDKSQGSEDNEAVITLINNSQAAILLVAFGMPQQEEWLAENWQQLNVIVTLTVGALFDTLAGDIPRAPRWVTDHGLEWLARLIIEPRRLWRRYIVGIPVFFWRILYHH